MARIQNTMREAAALLKMAEMASFAPTASSYAANEDPLYESKVVPIANVQPIERAPGVANFGEQRALAILAAIRSNVPLPPVRVQASVALREPYKYKLHDGFHRFHLSLALGFTHLPVAIMLPLDESAI